MAEEGFKELIKQTKETNDLLRKQAAAEGKPDPVKFVKEENPDAISLRNPSNKRAEKMINWRPLINLEDGIKTLEKMI